jgi:hypothetical protein
MGDTGITLVNVDPFYCSINRTQLFNTFGGDATKLATYLLSVPNNTILVGITGDDVTRNLQAAWSALTSIGAPVSDVTYRGSFVFVAQTGYANKTILRKSNSNSVPVNVTVTLEGAIFLTYQFTNCRVFLLNAFFLKLNEKNSIHLP